LATHPLPKKRPLPSGTVGGDVLNEIAKKYEATPRQIILAFLVRQHNVLTIPKSADVGHTIENAGGGEIELSARDLDRLDLAFPAPARDVALQVL